MQFLEVVFLFLLMLLTRFTIVRFAHWKVPTSDIIFFLVKCLIIYTGMIILPDKAAIKELAKASTQGIGNTFIIYYILGFPLTEIGVSGRGSIVFINNMLIYTLALYVYNTHLCNNEKSRCGQYLYLLLLFYPDLVYFGLFSLRDLGIATFCAFAVTSLLSKNYVNFVFWSLLLFLTRPEMILWLLLVLLFYGVFRLKFNGASIIFYKVTLVVICLSIPYAFFGFLRMNNWLISQQGIFDILNFLMEARYERQFSDSDGSGSTSPTLPRDLFYQASIFVKIFLQSLSLFYVSLAPSSIIIIISVISGLYPIYLWLKFFLIKAKYRTFLIMITISSYMIYSPFLVNGGNAFRLRSTFIVLVFAMLCVPNFFKKSNSR